ncbi:MAG: sugar ABC transporter permease [Microbacteriaceae bacterium]|nr:sugar ABC transporter permease [Microbacteriaceae bacterium]
MSVAQEEVVAVAQKEAVNTVKKLKRRRVEKPAPWAFLFILPVVVLFIVFEFYPMGRALFLSMQDTDQFGRPAGFSGFDNYITMFSDPEFIATLIRTFIFTIFSVLGKLALGLAIALPLSYRLKGTVWMRSVVLIPLAVSTAVGTLIFKQLFASHIGLFDHVLRIFGGSDAGWLTSQNMAMVSVIIVDIWAGISFVTLLMLVAIDGISGEVMEAANLDGATGWRNVYYIVLPSIVPMLLFLAVTQSISAMKEFTIINVLTDGGPGNATTTLVIDIYDKAFGGGTANFAMASTTGMILFVLTFVFTLVQFGLSSRKGR